MDMQVRFSKDIAAHVVTVLRDDGLYRHLRCAIPRGHKNAGWGWFDIITYPGSLVFSGDMGCYVFSRLPDMFEFFRGATPNYGYWSEKLDAVDRHGGVKEFCPDTFERAVRDDMEQFIESMRARKRMTDEQAEDLRRDVQYEVLDADNSHDALRAAYDFRWRGHEVFPDFWEHNIERYTTRFLWCCHAIQWTIRRYDAGEVTR